MQTSTRSLLSRSLKEYCFIATWWLMVVVFTYPQIQTAHAQNTKQHQTISERLNFYEKIFPSIQFVYFSDLAFVEADMRLLDMLLGYGAKSLDYQHPDDVRVEVTEIVKDGVEYKLKNGMVSASLFSVGRDSKARRKNICVLTIDPAQIALGNIQATRYMLDLSNQDFNQIHESNYLDSLEHLSFVVDHEVYHCLDAMFNGPIPMSEQLEFSEFAMFRNENGADAYGIAMHIRSKGVHTQYVHNLRRVRALSILNNDPNHYTDKAIDQVLALAPGRLVEMDAKSVFRLAFKISQKVAPDSRRYLHFRAAASQVHGDLGGVLDNRNKKFLQLADGGSLERETAQIYYRALSSYRELFSESAGI